METREVTRERISAFADGELADQDTDVTLAALRRPESHIDWEIYHQIGDVLRSSDMAVPLSSGFSARMAERLEMEPTIIGPAKEAGRCSGAETARQAISASDRTRRWSISGMIAAAAVAAIAFVATPPLMVAMKTTPTKMEASMMATNGQPPPVANVSAASPATEQVAAVTTVASQEGVLRDPRIDDYLLAHQRFSPSMYSTAQFARSATFETAPGK